MRLYHYYRSSCSWRIRAALFHKGLKAELEHINLLEREHESLEYKGKNPSGFLPCIEIQGEYYAESLGILEYLEEVYPQAPLLPSDPLERMRVRQLAHTIALGTQPLQNLAVQRYLKESGREFAKHWLERGLASYEKLCEKYAGSFSFGSQISHADICLIPQCYNALRFGIDLGRFPHVERIYNYARDLDLFRCTAPENYV